MNTEPTEAQNGHVGNGVVPPQTDMEKQTPKPERATLENNLELAMAEVSKLKMVYLSYIQ